MAVTTVNVEEFLALSRQQIVLDVRSPGEYAHASIPGALSLPLFTDDERRQVGTLYKQQGRQQAIKAGLDFFGPNMRHMVQQVEHLLKEKESDTLLLHCWRGGMRSGAVAWLLDLYGLKVYTLAGGYKAFRQWVLQQFEVATPFVVLGGYTGSGKTEILHQLSSQGEVVIDLEAVAGHRGSAFGNLGLPPQPSAEQIENRLALALQTARQRSSRIIWVEAESQRIGNINLPHRFYAQLQTAPLLFARVPFAARLDKVVSDYGKFEKEKLMHAILRIRKRMGGADTKEAVNYLLEDRLYDCFAVLLRYYDRYYSRSSFEAHPRVIEIDLPGINPNENAAIILQQKHTLL